MPHVGEKPDRASPSTGRVPAALMVQPVTRSTLSILPFPPPPLPGPAWAWSRDRSGDIYRHHHDGFISVVRGQEEPAQLGVNHCVSQLPHEQSARRYGSRTVQNPTLSVLYMHAAFLNPSVICRLFVQSLQRKL
jgi:hypothetical protein